MFDIIGKRKWILTAVAIYLVIAIAAIAVFRLKSGIEFSSGSILTIHFDQPVAQIQRRDGDLLQAHGFGIARHVVEKLCGIASQRRVGAGPAAEYGS